MKSLHRYVAALLFWGFVCAFLSGCKSPPSTDSWLILERKSTENPEIVSVMRDLPSAEIRSRFPTLLEIAWGYKSLSNGLPTEEELIFARTLYAKLDGIVGSHGVHAMTRSGDGGRTMYYYVQNVAVLREPIREFFDAQPPMSVRVSVREDPNWERIRETLNAIKP